MYQTLVAVLVGVVVGVLVAVLVGVVVGVVVAFLVGVVPANVCVGEVGLLSDGTGTGVPLEGTGVTTMTGSVGGEYVGTGVDRSLRTSSTRSSIFSLSGSFSLIISFKMDRLNAGFQY